MSLAHVGLKEMKKLGPLFPQRVAQTLSTEQNCLKVQRMCCWVGERGKDLVSRAHQMPARRVCSYCPSISPHGVVTPTVHNPGQLEKAVHVCTSKSFEIIPEPSTENTLGFTIW